jgi:hypothetical protein
MAVFLFRQMKKRPGNCRAFSFPAACRFDAALRDRPDGIGRPVGAAYFFVALSGSA